MNYPVYAGSIEIRCLDTSTVPISSMGIEHDTEGWLSVLVKPLSVAATCGFQVRFAARGKDPCYSCLRYCGENERFTDASRLFRHGSNLSHFPDRLLATLAIYRAIAGIVVGCLLLSKRLWLGIRIDLPQMMASLVSAGVAVSALVVFIRYFPVYIGRAGICSLDVFSNYRFLRWEMIERVQSFNLFYLRFLRIYSAELPQEMWLPLFLVDMSGFSEAVADFAGGGNPLVEWLLVNDY